MRTARRCPLTLQEAKPVEDVILKKALEVLKKA